MGPIHALLHSVPPTLQHFMVNRSGGDGGGGAGAGQGVEAVTDFLFLGSKITLDGDCSHEIKRCLLPGRNSLDNILKSRESLC